MNRRIGFLLAVAAQLAFLGWMTTVQEMTLRSGRAVVLAIEPFDPIDPLSGRYLAIRLRVSRVDLAKLSPGVDQRVLDDEAERLVGKQVAVTLREDDSGKWEAESIASFDEDMPGPQRVWLRGTALRREGNSVVVDFGLDKFFIPADAHDPSSLLWSRNHDAAIVARVAVDGRAVIEDLRIDGKRFAEWNAAQPK